MTVNINIISSLCKQLKRFFPERQPDIRLWKSILVLRPCCIGDILQSTALVAALDRAFPEATITYAVGPWSRPVLENNPHLDAIIDTGPVIGGKPKDLRAYWHLWRVLRNGHWDACFILERSPLFSLTAWLAGIKVRIGPDSNHRGVALTRRVSIRPRRSEAEACLDLARAVGVDVVGVATEFVPSPADNAEVEHVADNLSKKIVVLAPGGGVNPGTMLVAKRWSEERFGEIARWLAEQGYQPVLIGGSQDRSVTEKVQQNSDNVCLDFSGKLSLTGCGALLQKAMLFIGNDTGVMHLAAAVGTPVVALFGPTDPAMYAPYTQKVRVIWHPRHCTPCFREKTRPEDCRLECMYSITVDEVENAALRLLH